MSNFRKSGIVQYILIDLRASLWFVPALIILGIMALAIGLIELEHHVGDDIRRRWPRLFAIEAEGARSMLSTIAGSMATVAGVAFSITVVALVLASTQYSPRVLRNFMRDRANQVVLGVLIGVYIYCLLVLRTVGGTNGSFVPVLAVIGALALTIIACGAFIFFILHISTSIQASDMAATITRETLDVIDAMFPEPFEGNNKPALKCVVPENTVWQRIPATSMGYIESIDMDALFDIAKSCNTILRMERGMGDFAAPDRPVVSLALSHPPDQELVKAINRLYAIDTYRTIEQDPAFGIRQLVDIALRSISPSIDDTTTAVTCIEHLSVILARCAQRKFADTFRFEGDNLRLIAHQPDFSQLVSLAFNQVLETSEGNTEVTLCLLSAIEHIAGATRCPEDLMALERRVAIIEEIAMRSAKSFHAKEDIDAALQRVRAVLCEQKSRLQP